MGNCQAVDAATLVIQHPSGKVDTFYLPVSASEIMRMNPGHYVALLLSTTLYTSTNNGECPNNSAATAAAATTITKGSVRLTRIKLLRPTDTLALGHVYRLITTQEVMKGLWERKQAKLKKNQAGSAERLDAEARRSEVEKEYQVIKNERNRPKTAAASTNSAATARSRTWQPSLQSISEAVSQNPVFHQSFLPSCT